MKPSVVDCVGSDEGLVALAIGTIFSVVLIVVIASVELGLLVTGVVVSVIVDVVSVALLVVIVGGLCVVSGGVLITKTKL